MAKGPLRGQKAQDVRENSLNMGEKNPTLRLSMEKDQKRLFFGLEVQAPWPETLPQGRVLDEHNRHLTLAFLGNTDYPKLKEALSSFPEPSFKVGFVGQFDQCLFFPPKHPRVVAWHVDFLEAHSKLIQFYHTFTEWLQKEGFMPETRHSFTPHVTIARAPFNQRVWQKKFIPLPCLFKDIHLYESTGELNYKPIWSYPLLLPFEEISHAADIAFWVRGENYDQLYRHAQAALASVFPALLPFLTKQNGIENLDDVIIKLNELVATVDQAISCPFKAVSFHSHLEKKDQILHWEMIIDV